jgi:hypothetical protein
VIIRSTLVCVLSGVDHARVLVSCRISHDLLQHLLQFRRLEGARPACPNQLPFREHFRKLLIALDRLIQRYP